MFKVSELDAFEKHGLLLFYSRKIEKFDLSTLLTHNFHQVNIKKPTLNTLGTSKVSMYKVSDWHHLVHGNVSECCSMLITERQIICTLSAVNILGLFFSSSQ